VRRTHFGGTMIRLLAICGSRIEDGNMEAFLSAGLSHGDTLGDVKGELVVLAGKKINGCTHCNWCVRKQTQGKFCAQEDDMTPIYEKVLSADGLILASPAHFGRLSGLLANAIDRLRVFVHGKAYGRALKNKIGGAMAVAFYRGAGLETTLASINSAFHTLGLITAHTALYHQGAGGVTSRDGKGRFEASPRRIVLEDEAGLGAAKQLVERMVELSRIVKAGEAALKTMPKP
jgi:multimeric flavodoxin WrbA